MTLTGTNRRSLYAVLDVPVIRAKLFLDDDEQIMDAAHTAERALADKLMSSS